MRSSDECKGSVIKAVLSRWRLALFLAVSLSVLSATAQAAPDCDVPNGVFPVAPGASPEDCNELWGVHIDEVTGEYSWQSSLNSGYMSACWNSMNAYYGSHNPEDIPANPYRDNSDVDSEAPAPLSNLNCGLSNMETEALAIAPPYGFAAPFKFDRAAGHWRFSSSFTNAWRE